MINPSTLSFFDMFLINTKDKTVLHFNNFSRFLDITLMNMSGPFLEVKTNISMNNPCVINNWFLLCIIHLQYVDIGFHL